VCVLEYLCVSTGGGGGGMEEIKVRIYGAWTSYTYMKENKETSFSCFK
jgi:hypothetical protein